MKKFLRLAPFLIALLMLTGCSTYEGYFGNDSNGSDDNRKTVAMKWYSTERGDVYCTDLELPYSTEQHDCDWATLGKKPADETTDGGLPAQWVRTDKGEVWCLVNSTSHSGHTTSCDWATLGKRVNSGRLPVF